MTFDTFLNGEYIGPTFLDNVFLQAGGVNNFTMHANISQTPVISVLGQKPYCTNGGDVPFQLQGKAVINNGQPLNYYANSLSTANQTIILPLGQDVKTLLGSSVPCS